MSRVLILRPRPGADETAAKARRLGLDAVVAPLFAYRPLAWTPPDPARFDALLLTSAAATRLAGDGLTSFAALPCYAVGARTAEAAREAGLADPRTGPADGAALIAQAAADGVTSALHLCGRDHIPLAHPGVEVTALPVYVAEPRDAPPPMDEDMLVLLHSPRAGRHFAALAGDSRANLRIAAISPAAAEAAGDGWRGVAVASEPRDDALLELAAKLCQTGGRR